MSYTVVWTKSAEADLVRIWTESADRTAVTAAGNAIDARLRRDPTEAGESRESSRRTLLIELLGVDFVVRAEDQLVAVIAVWTWD
jgi:plasmid stabilization system protein ParE